MESPQKLNKRKGENKVIWKVFYSSVEKKLLFFDKNVNKN